MSGWARHLSARWACRRLGIEGRRNHISSQNVAMSTLASHASELSRKQRQVHAAQVRWGDRLEGYGLLWMLKLAGAHLQVRPSHGKSVTMLFEVYVLSSEWPHQPSTQAEGSFAATLQGDWKQPKDLPCQPGPQTRWPSSRSKNHAHNACFLRQAPKQCSLSCPWTLRKQCSILELRTRTLVHSTPVRSVRRARACWKTCFPHV